MTDAERNGLRSLWILPLIGFAMLVVFALLPRNKTPRQEPTLPRIVAFTATPNRITSGDAVELRWSTENAESVEIQPGLPHLAKSGSDQVSPKGPQAYKLIARNKSGVTDAEVIVDVSPAANVPQAPAPRVPVPPPPSSTGPAIESFSSSAAQILAGDTASLAWKVLGADHVFLDSVEVAPQDRRDVRPASRTVYVLRAAGNGKTVSSQTTIEVSPRLPPRVQLSVEALQQTVTQDMEIPTRVLLISGDSLIARVRYSNFTSGKTMLRIAWTSDGAAAGSKDFDVADSDGQISFGFPNTNVLGKRRKYDVEVFKDGTLVDRRTFSVVPAK